MIIDMHAHTTNSQLWDLHTKTANIPKLERLARKYGIDLIVLMATYFPFKRGGLHNRQLLAMIEGKKRFRMFASLDAMNKLAEGITELREMVEHTQVVGIKLYPGYQNFRLSDAAMDPVYELAEEKNLSVAIHTGELHHCCPKDGQVKYSCQKPGRCQIDKLGHLAYPREVEPVAKRFPRVNFIMCHLGNPLFMDAVRVMKNCPNVHTDLSGQFITGVEGTESYRAEIWAALGHFLDLEHGVERLLFGSDFPIQSHADSIALVKSLHLSPEDEEKVFSGNAKRLLNLKEA